MKKGYLGHINGKQIFVIAINKLDAIAKFENKCNGLPWEFHEANHIDVIE